MSYTVDCLVIVDVAARRAEDLDEDLANYFIEYVRETGQVDFVIHFMFEFYPSEEFMLRVRTSVQKIFISQRKLEPHLFTVDGTPSFLNTPTSS